MAVSRKRFKIEQLELQLEAGHAEKREQTEKMLAPAAAVVFAAATRKPERRPLANHLPREVAVHEPEQKDCPACGGQLSELGEHVSEMLEYGPHDSKSSARSTEIELHASDTIVQAEAPTRPIARGLLNPGAAISSTASHTSAWPSYKSPDKVNMALAVSLTVE